MPEEGSSISYEDIEQEIERMQSDNPRIREEGFGSIFRISKEIGSACTTEYMIPFVRRILDANEEARKPIIKQIDKIGKELLRSIDALIPIYKEILLTRDERTRKDASRALVSSVMHHAQYGNKEEGKKDKGKKEEAEEKIEEVTLLLATSRFIMHRVSAVAVIEEYIREKEIACTAAHSTQDEGTSDKSTDNGHSDMDASDNGHSSDTEGMPQPKRQKSPKMPPSFTSRAPGISSPRIKQLFMMLISDQSSLVRKNALTALSALNGLCTEQELFDIVSQTLSDPEDVVRCQFVYPFSAIENHSGTAEKKIVVFKQAAKNTSWLVRCSVSAVISSVIVLSYVYDPTVLGSTMACVEALARDQEVLVRKSTAQSIPQIFSAVSSTKPQIFQLVSLAARDASEVVRQCVAEILAQVSASLSISDVETCVFPVIRGLLSDKDSTTKTKTILALKVLYSKLGPAAVSEALTPIVQDLRSPSWRTRAVVLQSIASLSRQVEGEYFRSNLRQPFFRAFQDPIWEVRKEAANTLGSIAAAFGPDWVLNEALADLSGLKSNSKYTFRISYIWGLRSLLDLALDWPGALSVRIISEFLELASDSVAQVRLAVLRAIQGLGRAEKEVAGIRKALEGDESPEVRRELKGSGPD